ncbi:hypothetical protein OHA21_29150 [Actinoplanes sp. NBC_00393]|uniref:hypothetical protein n=1 Tax=Actinoplanes sp. NBC_00393 TaxID=2975953 RepID=UPI002E22E838
MSAMTLQDLLSFDVGPWHAAVDRWRQLGQGVDKATDLLIQGTRDLAHAWPDGAGSVATGEEATTLRAAVDNTYNRVTRMREVMDQHAYAMTALRQQAENVLAAARQAGYTVDTAAMTITAPASAYLGGNLDRTGRETGTLLNDLRSVVEYARAQDDATAASINENVPSGQAGFGTATPAAIARATELARKLKDPAYQPTAAELDELRDLIKLHGRDRAFAYDVLNALGPKGLLELNGTLATYQPDYPGRDTDSALFSNYTAEMVGDLQNGLGVMLDTATEPTGTRGGLRGEDYVPGAYELSSQWVTGLMAAGRSRMDVGDPSNPGLYMADVYGYQLLSPLLHNGSLDPAFVATVGGDIIDFEMEQGRSSALWTESRGENVRLDWTQNHDDNNAPAGYDPMSALMDGLSRNGEGALGVFTGVTEYTAGGPEGGRLPRVDYLLTDRNWDPDVSGGPAWAAEVMGRTEGDRNSVLEDFGTALERATTDQRGPEATRLVESIVLETNVDEEVTQKFDEWNSAKNSTDEDVAEAAKKGFADIDVIKPEMRGSMANIMGSYIIDVNQNLAAGQPVGSESFKVGDPTHLTRFLADIGKDPGAHSTIAVAEAGYAAGMHDHILSGRQNPADDLRGNLDAIQVVSHNYGNVMGAVDFGAEQADHTTSRELDEKQNHSVENRYRIIGPLVEGFVGAATSPIPGGPDLANAVVGDVLDDLEKGAKIDSTGRVTYDVASVLGAGRTTAVDLVETSLYNSGKLEGLPEILSQGGQPRPMDQWSGTELRRWIDFKGGEGMSTVGRAATGAAESYQNGYEWAADTLNGNPPKGGESR